MATDYTLPLNPTLYRRLCESFGQVEIAKRGESFSGHYYNDGSRLKLNVQASGEYYRVNCPFCHLRKANAVDTRKRLWINHLWGVPNEVGGSHWHLAHCFNEGCLEDPRFLQQLRTLIYADFNLHQRKQLQILPGKPAAPMTEQVDWPGDCLPLHTLQADHPAVQWLRDVRGFDPAYLSHRWGARYCLTPLPEYPHLTNRLIVPIIYNGKMVSWQARYLGDANWRVVPKFYNQSDSRKNTVLYNFDVAKRYPFVAVNEGYFDTWRIGDAAVAVLGKTVSEAQLRLLISTWKVVLLALDDDAYYESEEAYRRLSTSVTTVRIPLPGKDPDQMTQEEFWELAWRTCASQGIDLLSLRS